MQFISVPIAIDGQLNIPLDNYYNFDVDCMLARILFFL